MKLIMLAVRDRAADTFARPMFVPAVGVGLRSFVDEINRADKDNPLYMHPDDFDLFVLGEYEDSEGVFVSHSPRQVAVGKDCAKRLNGSE